MKLPKLENSSKFIGLYVIDFGDHSATGYTAPEVSLLLESEKFQHIKVYKIHNAYSDGKLELKGVSNNTFSLEMGMFFHEPTQALAAKDYKKLIDLAITSKFPCTAKVNLAKYSDDKFATAIIFPAEYNDQVSDWLLANKYQTTGSATGGIDEVTKYYEDNPEIVERHQFLALQQTRDINEILESLKQPVQRYA